MTESAALHEEEDQDCGCSVPPRWCAWNGPCCDQCSHGYTEAHAACCADRRRVTPVVAPEQRLERLLGWIAADEAQVAAVTDVYPGRGFRFKRECETKRRILAEHAFHVHPAVDGPRCVTCASGDENGADWPCETIRALESVYEDPAR